MKRHFVHATMTAMLGVALSGCLEIETTTRVHPDGRLTRTVVVSGDTSDFAKIQMAAFGLDSGWTVVSDSMPHGKDRKLTLQREFKDAESASRALGGVPLERRGIAIRLEKKFRWFTTLYRYEETWQKVYLFNKIPISDYLSTDEIQIFRAGELKNSDSLLTTGEKRSRADLDKRAQEWVTRNSFQEVFDIFLDGVRRVNDARLSPDSVQAAKERLYAEVKAHASDTHTRFEEVMIGALPGVLKNPVVSRALDAVRPELEQHRRAVDFMERIQVPGQTLGVVMPGIIANTNGSSVEGSTVRWKDFKDIAFYDGYTMWAESSMVNWWAVVVTAIVLLGIGSLLVVGLLRKRGQPGYRTV